MKSKKRLISVLLSAVFVVASGTVPVAAAGQESGEEGMAVAEVTAEAFFDEMPENGMEGETEAVTIVAKGTEGKYDTIHWTIDSNGLLTVSGNGVPNEYTGEPVITSHDGPKWCAEQYCNLIKTAYVNLDTKECDGEDMRCLFWECENLEKCIFEGDYSGIDRFSDIFYGCDSLMEVIINTDTMSDTIKLPISWKNAMYVWTNEESCYARYIPEKSPGIYSCKTWEELSGLHGKTENTNWSIDSEGHLEVSGNSLSAEDGNEPWFAAYNDEYGYYVAYDTVANHIKTATVAITFEAELEWDWFSWSENLESVDFSDSDLSKLCGDSYEMFSGCDKLKTVKVPANVGCDIELPVVDGRIWKCNGKVKEHFILGGMNRACTYENADWGDDITIASESENISWLLNNKGEFVMEAKDSLPFEGYDEGVNFGAVVIRNQLPWKAWVGYVKKAKFKLHDCEDIQANIQCVNYGMENVTELDYSECDFPKEEVGLWYDSLCPAKKVVFPANANVKYVSCWSDRYWLDENNCQVERVKREEGDDWWYEIHFKTGNQPMTFICVTEEEYNAAAKSVTPPTDPPENPAETPEKPTNPPTQTPDPKPAEPGTVGKTEDGSKITVTKSEDGTASASYTAPSSKKNKKATVPDTVTVNGVQYKVTGIGKGAFKNNKKLTTVKIGKNVSQIGKGAFSGCTKLKSVTLPKSVEKIEAEAFKGDKSLKTITIKSTNIKSVGKNAFKGIKGNAVIKVPASKLKEYTKLFRNAGLPETVKIRKI